MRYVNFRGDTRHIDRAWWIRRWQGERECLLPFTYCSSPYGSLTPHANGNDPLWKLRGQT